MHKFAENLGFPNYQRARDYRDSNGLAWSHFIQWDGRYYRVYPHYDRLNAAQRKHYKEPSK